MYEIHLNSDILRAMACFVKKADKHNDSAIQHLAITNREHDLEIAGTDGYILGVYRSAAYHDATTAPIGQQILVPPSLIEGAAKLPKGPAVSAILEVDEQAKRIKLKKFGMIFEAELPNMDFPNYHQIMSETHEPTTEIALDAALLERFGKAAKLLGTKSVLHLTFNGMAHQVRVQLEHDDQFEGVLMPVRTSKRIEEKKPVEEPVAIAA